MLRVVAGVESPGDARVAEGLPIYPGSTAEVLEAFGQDADALRDRGFGAAITSQTF
jgi:hypothetical protein